MPLLGAHVSTAGGVGAGLDRAEKINCQAAQLFTKSNRCWVENPLDPGEVERFRSRIPRFGRENLVSHAAYLINLCAKDEEVYRRSMAAMLDELVRAESLGLSWVIVHPGSHGGLGEEWGIRRVVESLNLILKKTKGFKTGILLETTAGQGASLGWKFEQLGSMLRHLRPASRIGVCVDTCHIFAAGYDIRDSKSYNETVNALDHAVGLPRVKFFHLNDSVKGLGSRVDRHEHIGKGEIGLEAFRCLMNDPRFAGLPMVLETPKGPDMKEDVMNLKKLRGMIHRSCGARNRIL